MAQFRAFEQGVEVNGETVHAFIDGMGGFKQKAVETLAAHGITDPQPGQWYKQQAYLDAFKDIAEKVGAATLYGIGLKIPEHAEFPPDINTLAKALPSIDVAYHMNHRGGEIGHYQLATTGVKSFKMVCNNPYPCDFDRGIIGAICRRFRPDGSPVSARVAHDDTAPCRKKAASSCTYLVTW
jgi:hypothetical protein